MKEKTVRLSIALPLETKEIYQRMAKAAGLSLSKTIAEWLADTGDAALFTSLKMEEARNAPTQVFNDLLSMTAGAREAIFTAKSDLRKTRKGAPSAPARSALHPPSSNTGGYGNKSGPSR